MRPGLFYSIESIKDSSGTQRHHPPHKALHEDLHLLCLSAITRIGIHREW